MTITDKLLSALGRYDDTLAILAQARITCTNTEFQEDLDIAVKTLLEIRYRNLSHGTTVQQWETATTQREDWFKTLDTTITLVPSKDENLVANLITYAACLAAFSNFGEGPWRAFRNALDDEFATVT